MTSHLTSYRGLLGCEVQRMTREQAEAFVQLVLMEVRDPSGERLGKDLGLEKPPGLRILEHRLDFAKVTAHPALRLYLTLLCTSPGECVLWAYTCAVIQDEQRLPLVTLRAWTEHFPNGVPTPAAYDAAWVAQRRCDGSPKHNWLDCPEQWPQLRARAS